MKVAVITRHAIANYGSILQAYATERILEQLGHDVEIIDYIPIEEKTENLVFTYIKNSKLWNKNFLTRKIYQILQDSNIRIMNQKFEEYRHSYLKMTDNTYHTLEGLKKDCPKADVYCTGSDQVWGKIGNQLYDEAYFLEFLDKGQKCISYAGSFGKDHIDEELKVKLKQYMKKYSHLLVRENTAVQILKDVGCTNVKQVLDPTLLLAPTEWNKLCHEVDEKRPYILIYHLRHNKQFEAYAKKVSKKMGLPLVRINVSKYFKYKAGEFKYLPSPSEFLSYIRNAELVLTDSFHGTVFSILFGKNFVEVLPGVTSTRIVSLLDLFHLQDRLISSYDDFSVLDRTIDYGQVHTILKEERKKSLEDLKNSLK